MWLSDQCHFSYSAYMYQYCVMTALPNNTSNTFTNAGSQIKTWMLLSLFYIFFGSALQLYP